MLNFTTDSDAILSAVRFSATLVRFGSEDLPYIRVRVALLTNGDRLRREGKFFQAFGDPFQVILTDLPLQDRNPAGTADYELMTAAVVLIEFSSSDLWRNHPRPPPELQRSMFVLGFGVRQPGLHNQCLPLHRQNIS